MNGYNFTERVRKVLAMTRESAAQFHHEYVGPEHILLGILREHEGVAAAVLTNLGPGLDELTASVEGRLQPGKPEQATGPDLPYTSQAKKVLELAMAEARDLNHPYVGTEHVLIALLREERGIAAQVLREAKMTTETVRAETLRLLGTEEPPRDRPQPPVRAASSSASNERGIAEITINIRHHDGSTVRGEFPNWMAAMQFLTRNAPP